MLKKQFRTVMTFILVITLVMPFFITSVNAAYENTYYNTGNMREDIIGVALTQVGYTEGYNNYTKYGEWYGYPNLPWCGMFVSWCAKEAGIPSSVLNRTGLADPSCFGLSYVDGYDYTPQMGDLFFKKDFSHVGLVYYTDGSYFYTVEGNTSDTSWEGTSVLIQRRRISDCYFSSPDYSGDDYSDDGYIDYGCNHNYITEFESEHPHSEYEICTECDDFYYTGYEGVDDDCTICIQENCSHDYGNWSEYIDGTHSRICSDCDYQETEYHNWETGRVLKDATCVDEGSLEIICSDCGAESTESIDATGEHTMSSFSYINEMQHQTVCNVCKMQTVSDHVLSGDWKADGIYHWTSCADCSGQIQRAEHRFINGCTEPCADCGYVSQNGHKTNSEFLHDESQHWQVCLKCNLKVNVTAHTYSSDCDEICNSCGYNRRNTVAHSDELHSNDAGHWSHCTACDRVTEPISHTPDEDAQEWDTLTCIHCNYELRSSDGHVHSFTSVESDAHTHWGTCECGEELQAEVHMWDFKTNTCSICGTENTPAKENTGNFLIVFFRNLFKI